MKIDVTIRPTWAAVKKKLQRQAKAISKLERAHKRIAVLLDTWVQRNFTSSGQPVGGWLPLKHREGKPLLKTGRLRNSFSMFWSRTNAGVGSDLDYSKYHNEGTRWIPRRRILPQEREVKPDITRIYNEHVSRMIRSTR